MSESTDADDVADTFEFVTESALGFLDCNSHLGRPASATSSSKHATPREPAFLSHILNGLVFELLGNLALAASVKR